MKTLVLIATAVTTLIACQDESPTQPQVSSSEKISSSAEGIPNGYPEIDFPQDTVFEDTGTFNLVDSARLSSSIISSSSSK